MKVDIDNCSCGNASVEYDPAVGYMDYWIARVNNATSKKAGYKRIYTCDDCGENFSTCDPSMILFED